MNRKSATLSNKKLFWVYTYLHEEDWFIVAKTKAEARKYHEEYEGFEYGDAKANLVQKIEKNYEKKAVYHAQLPMLEDMGFAVLSEAPYRVVIKNGKVYQEGSTVKFSILNASIKKEGVYLIHAIGTDFYKIGFTKNLHRRLESIQTGSPLPIELYNFWRTTNSKLIECILHNHYREWSIGKEWFKLTFRELGMIHEEIVILRSLDFSSLVSARNSSEKIK